MRFKKVWNAFTSVLIGVVVVFALLLAGARLIGLKVFTVLSGSMQPAYSVGALVYVKPTDAEDYKVGDAITFMMDENTVVTHRIVEIVPDEEDSTVLRFRTKGDANDVADGTLVHYKNVLGRVVFSLPYLGYAASYMQTRTGFYITIAFVAVLLLLVFVPDLIGKEGEKRKPPDTA